MQYELHKAKNLWWWRLRAGNNEVVASGEGYYNREDAVHAVNLLMDTSRKTKFVEVNA